MVNERTGPSLDPMDPRASYISGKDLEAEPRHAAPASPLDVACPACNAKIGKPCTAPTDTGRRNVTWFHNYRTDLAREAKV